MSCATMCGGLSVGGLKDHAIGWVAMVEFVLLVYQTQTDQKAMQVLALDNYSVAKLAPDATFIQLKRRDGGIPVYLHGASSLLRQW